MAKVIELRTIADLERLGPKFVRKLLRQWDFAGELRDWAGEASKLGIPWETRHNWNEKRTKYRFHPSSFKHKCDMKLFFQLVGGEEKRKRQPKQALFDTGTAIHLQMNYYMQTMALYYDWQYDEEVELWKGSAAADEYMMCGSADGVFEREITIDGQTYLIRIIIDWKSINSAGFTKLGDTPGSDYSKQMHGYMVSGDIPITFVLFINKDNSVFKNIPLLYTPKIWDPIGTRLKGIIEKANNMEEPIKTVAGHCTSCAFLEECKPKGLRKSMSRGRRSTRREPRL